MILSMTGFGQSKTEIDGRVVKVEIKSLNARNTELRCKLPGIYRSREIELRKKVIDALTRGKFDMTITVDGFSDQDNTFINANAFRKYYQELESLKNELGIEDGDILQAILRIPNVIGQDDDMADDEEWKLVEGAIDKAMEQLKSFRKTEGSALRVDMLERIDSIEKYLKAVEPFESARIDKLKERLRKNLDEFLVNQQVDQNRYEQEIIYYIEKFDINEEKVRLEQHCNYFRAEVDSDDKQTGRKLSFIAQEIGREINTMGAKANDSEIQRYVVNMKDELEKLKEQLANIL